MVGKGILPKGYKYGICISHDVDHLRHYYNLDLIKFWGVSFIELIYGKRNFGSFVDVLYNSFNKKNDSWNQTELLASVNKKDKISATFFFAVERGRGIDYGHKEIKEAIGKLKGFEISVHGQEFENILGIEEEFEQMQNLLGKKPIGIRMHYLNFNAEKTPELLKKAGYVYDSTEFSENLKQPYKIANGLIEIPLHIMDTYLFSPFYKNFSLEEAKNYTLKLIAKAKKEKKILNVLIHLRHLAPEFERQRAYYLWLVDLISKDKKCHKISLREITNKLK